MVQEWVINWFEKKAKKSRDEILENLNAGYLEEAYIDSMEFIELIGEVEDHFGIQFSDDDFLDEKILTISGLINKIESEMQNDR